MRAGPTRLRPRARPTRGHGATSEHRFGAIYVCLAPLPTLRVIQSIVMSMCRGLPEKIGVHNPPLLSLGLASDPLDLVHAPFQVTRHENLIFGSDVGAPVDVDLWVADVLERTFCVEHHNDIVAIIGQPLRYLAPGGNMNRLSDPVQSDLMARGQGLNAAYSRNHFVFECNGSSGNDPIDDP